MKYKDVINYIARSEDNSEERYPSFIYKIKPY